MTSSASSLRFRRLVPALFSGTGVLLASAPSLAASWQANVQYGGNMSTDYYVPDNAADPAPIVVALHYCGGTKGNAQQWFRSDADRLGFIIITPQAGGNCFDAGLGKSGERAEIVKMLDYAVSQFGGDVNHAYAVGDSSGACMTQALLASYPERFAAGSSLAGTPAGAWTGGNAYGWSAPQQSAEAWGDKVREVNPSFMGPWPRVQIWHGEGDTNLTYSQTFPAEEAQWSNVWGLADATESSVQFNNTWARKEFTDANGIVGVETNHAPGVQHDLSGSGLWGDVVRFMLTDEPADRGGPATGAGGAAAGGASSESGAGGVGVGVGGAEQAGMGTGMMPAVAGSASAGMAAASGGSASTSMGGTSVGPVMGGAGTSASAGTGTTTGMPTGTTTTTPTGTTTTTPTGTTTTTPTGTAGSTSTASAGAPAGAAAGAAGVVMGGDVPAAKGCSVGAETDSASPRSLAALGLLAAFGLAFRRRRRTAVN